MKLKLKFSLPLILLLFFMFLGYLETGILGIFAGLIAYGISSVTLPLSLIPFVGFFLWYASTFGLLDNISLFLHIPILREKVLWIFGLQAGIFCSLTSILTLIAIYLIWKYLLHRKETKVSSLRNLIDYFKDIVKNIPKEKWNELIHKIKELIGKIDKDIVGSALFWLGIGIASHDFHWESEEREVDTERPTHGTYFGLSLASTGIQLMQPDCLKNLLFYFGVGLCYLGFNLLSIIPKGFSRLIAHVFWWSGTSLMIYHWYSLIKDKLFKEDEIKQIESLILSEQRMKQ